MDGGARQPLAPNAGGPAAEGIRNAAEAFLSVQTLADCQNVVEMQQQVLLTDAVVQYLDRRLASAQEPTASYLRKRRELLLLCRHEGIADAFADYLLRSEICEASLALVSATKEPKLWANLRCEFWESVADFHSDHQRWHEAYARYDKAIGASHMVLVHTSTLDEQDRVVQKSGRLFTQAAYCLVRTGRYAEALLLLDAGKARLLHQHLTLSETDLTSLSPALQQAFVHQWQAVRRLQAEFASRRGRKYSRPAFDRFKHRTMLKGLRRKPTVTELDHQLEELHQKMESGQKPAASSRRGERKIADELMAAWRELDALVCALRATHPACLPAALDLPSILSLIPARGALIIPLVASQGTVIFVLPHGAQAITDEHIIRLDTVTEHDLDRWLYLDRYRDTGKDRFGWKWAYWFRTGAGYWEDSRQLIRAIGWKSWSDAYRLRHHQYANMLSSWALMALEVLDVWRAAMLQGWSILINTVPWLRWWRERQRRSQAERWQAFMAEASGQMWDELMQHIHARLQRFGLEEGAQVVLIPQGGLAMLPLHAAWRKVDGKRRYLLDDYTFTYAPALSALKVCIRRAKDERRHQPAVLAVINPTQRWRYTLLKPERAYWLPLSHAHEEGTFIVRWFPDTARLPLEGDKATQQAIVTGAPNYAYLHFACHAYYDWDDPRWSGLVLADGSFHLDEIIWKLDLSKARLVTLSACETGLAASEVLSEEFIGLPSGCIQAGAPGVLGTLWQVDDRATSLLLARFYELHCGEKMAPAQALRAAQRWLRDATREALVAYCTSYLGRGADFALEGKDGLVPFADPYYWAAFAFTGA